MIIIYFSLWWTDNRFKLVDYNFGNAIHDWLSTEITQIRCNVWFYIFIKEWYINHSWYNLKNQLTSTDWSERDYQTRLLFLFYCYNNSGDFVTMSHLSCCGMQFANKFSLRRHTNTKHKTATPIFRCHVEDCLRRFKTSATLKIHQKERLYASNVFYLKSHALNGTSLVLRRDLLEEGLPYFDLISPTDGIEEIKRIINSAVEKRTLCRSWVQ